MIDFIMSNLQGVLLGAAALTGIIYTLTGFERIATETDEFKIGYQGGRWRRNIAVTGILVALAATCAFVPKGHVGVVYDLNGGIQSTELSEGFHVVFPFKQHVTNVNVQVHKYVHNDEDVWQHTLDTQEIRIPIAVNWRVSPTDASYALQNILGDPATTIIEPALLRSLRTAIGQYELENVAVNQDKINGQIQAEIGPQAAAYGLEITYVAIQDTIAKTGILQSIENEKIAERDKITAEHNRDIARTNAEAAVLTAEGQAKAIKEIQSSLISSPEYLTYLRLEKWNGQLPQTLLDGGEDVILNLP